ncbi:hypothetical protein [Mucilaginibacter sp. SG564]|uniref:hypothetical protein n=1 Tax=unclassified Mucilaginibacter TaxID=2617802 RepID=UPI001557E4E8|nr:hypothetical protein [Mucilaginibacter sp. SG564]NOW94734.1 hypothetical protein [Mucilaginibacter sp. SG564]
MNDDYINTTAIFGEVKKQILSKEFKYGQLTNLFGRTTVDFSNADLNGAVVLDCTQFCGEIRIKAPAGWHVIPEVTNIFMVVDDKRRNRYVDTDKNKTLILRGVGIFASINIMD